MLNQDVKTNALGRRRPLDVTELKSRRPTLFAFPPTPAGQVTRYFHERHVTYAAAPTS